MTDKPDLSQLCADLQAERADLFGLVSGLDDDGWDTPTPAPGWSIRDQLNHLAFFDDAARQSIDDPDGFRAHRAEALAGVDDYMDSVRARHAKLSGEEVQEWLREAGDRLCEAALVAGPSVRVPWYGPDMSVASSITARIMETWAHGQDVADALGVTREATERLRHIAFIGWRAIPNSYIARGREVPTEPVRVEVGDWTFGPEDADNVVRGSALDFCLVVTQRRHHADTDLVAEGTVAEEWLPIAQAFAGPPGEGREPGQFA